MLLKLSNLTIEYQNGFVVCKGINFETVGGSVLSIIGPSGCGKTSILMAIAGLINSYTGNVTISRSVPTVEKKMIGFVFQRDVLFPWRTVRKNIELPLEIVAVPKKSKIDITNEMASKLDILNLLDKYPRELSEGQKQKVSIALAVVQNPDLLLLDEPFSSLDDITRFTLNQNLLQMLTNSNRVIIYVTHNIDEAVFVSDRIIILSKRPGRIVGDYPIPLARPRSISVIDGTNFKRIVTPLRRIVHSQ